MRTLPFFMASFFAVGAGVIFRFSHAYALTWSLIAFLWIGEGIASVIREHK